MNPKAYATARARLYFASSGNDEIILREIPADIRAELIDAIWSFLPGHFGVGRPFTQVKELHDYEIELKDGRPNIDRAEIFDRLRKINEAMGGQLDPRDASVPEVHWDIGESGISCVGMDIEAGDPAAFPLPAALLAKLDPTLQQKIASQLGNQLVIQLRYSFHLEWPV